MNNITEEKYDSASAFLDALRPSASRWLPAESYSHDWVFRGQADANWHLSPSAWRPGQPDIGAVSSLLSKMAPEQLAAFVGTGVAEYVASCSDYIKLQFDKPFARELDSSTLKDRIRAYIFHLLAEIVVVRDFLHFSDELGHHAQRCDDAFRSLHSSHFVRSYGLFFDRTTMAKKLLDGTELAQHHNIPTRLLDWTRNPLAAAYFASLVPDYNGLGSLAVWALRPPEREGPQREPHIQVLRYARSVNRNLHAQGGLFIHCAHPSSHSNSFLPFYVEHGRWPDMDRDMCEELELRKLILPHAHARELQRLLWVEGVSEAHLMPGYDSVAKTVRRLWSLGFFANRN